MVRRRIGRCAMVLPLLVVLAGGCAVGPSYERPKTVAPPEAYVAAPDTSGVVAPATAPDFDWWRQFGSPELDALVDEALVASPDLVSAAGRVMEAAANRRGTGWNWLPSVDLSGSGSRSKVSRAMFGQPGSFYNNSYSASAQGAWELDLWGRLSSTRRSAWASLLASEADQRAVRQTLIANVVTGWLGAREATQQYELAVETHDTYARTLTTVENRYEAGVVSSLDVHLARQNLAAAAARRDLSRQGMLTARYALEVLVGRYPAGEAASHGEDLAALPEPASVPAGLPSDLLQRRPDLIAAEMRLVSAVASIGVAKADLFPRLSLTGSAGFTSTELSDLFEDTASVWNLAANLSMPLLNRGARAAQVGAAEGRAEQARGAYVATVLNGFRDVETALTADREQDARRRNLRDSVRHAERSLSLANDRYERGLVPLTTVLDTQQRLFLARSDLLQAERGRREARVNLILALGGDWDEDPAASDDE